jgi:hypothetical protein
MIDSMTRTAPPKLYKYQPYNVQTLDNLKDRRLWLSKPARFNDPFDCARFQIADMTEDDWKVLYDWVREDAPIRKVVFDAKYSQEGHPNDRFKAETIESAEKWVAKRVEVMRHQRGVACFSEKVDDIQMWAHYAEGHRGFCLEFDTSYDPFPKAFPVIYSDTLPSLNPADVLVKGSTMMAMVTTKSSCWSYEKEWRIFHMEGDKEYGVDVSALTGVYFGCAMPFVHKEVIALVLAGSPTRLYEMQESKTEFKVSVRPVEYTPYDYTTRLTST